MPELMRFEIARAVQRQRGSLPVLPVGTSQTVQTWLAGDGVVGQATGFLAGRGLNPPARRYVAPSDQAAVLEQVRRLDRFLANNDNDPERADMDDFMTSVLDGDANALLDQFSSLWDDLTTTVVAIVIADAHVDLRADVVRLVLVIGLVRLLAGIDGIDTGDGDGQSPEVRAADLSREDRRDALRVRDVALPENLVEAVGGPHSLLVRPPGVADLWVARDEWARYEAGEIAHIENVLIGELKSRLLDKLTEVETTDTTDTEKTSVVEQDSQTTNRFELVQEAKRDTDLVVHVEGQVDTSGQYGPTKVTTHLGGSLDYSVAESTSVAVKQSKESIQRAVTRVEEKVSEQRTRRQLTRVREADRHQLDNSKGKDHVTGIYRWVDKIQRVQLFKYPNRTLFEFEIPEPASFVRWLARRPLTGVRGINPPPFTIDGTEDGVSLTPGAVGQSTAEVGKTYYQTLGSRYYAAGLPPPPVDTVVFATVTNPDPDTDVAGANKPPKYATATVAVPAGYEGTSFSIYTVGTNAVAEAPGKPTGWYELVVGTDFPSTVADDGDAANIWRFQGKGIFRGLKSMAFRKPVAGTVPILLATDDSSGGIASIEVRCSPTADAVAQWRQKVYDALAAAYWQLKNQYDDEVAQRSIRAGINVEGDSPQRNQQRVQEELHKFVIEMLTGDRFLGRDAIGEVDLDPGDKKVTAPAIELKSTVASAAEIQFLEQVFEWENLTYILYPYFWGGSKRWAELNDVKSPDPAFDEFLRCGSARVVLPARPGFQGQATLYTLFGTLWGGGAVPTPGDDLYLSVAEEIRAQQRPITDGEPGETWEVRLPTTLLYLAPKTTLPLENDHAELPVQAPSALIPEHKQADRSAAAPTRTRRRG